MLTIYFALILNISYAQKTNEVAPWPCQIEMANDLLKKFNLKALPVKVKSGESCDQFFCAIFEFTKEKKFKDNLLPVGTTIRVCKEGGLKLISRNDGKGFDAGHGLECRDRINYGMSGTVSCDLAKPYKVQGLTLYIKNLFNYQRVQFFSVSKDIEINGQQLVKGKSYTLMHGKIDALNPMDEVPNEGP